MAIPPMSYINKNYIDIFGGTHSNLSSGGGGIVSRAPAAPPATAAAKIEDQTKKQKGLKPQKYYIGNQQVSSGEYANYTHALYGRPINPSPRMPGTNITPETIQAQKNQEATSTIQQAGGFEQVSPETLNPNLQPPTSPADSIVPIIGRSGSAIAFSILELLKNPGKGLSSTESQFPITGETVRDLALEKIRKDSYDQGISGSETFGAMVEGIPVIGSLVNKYARGIIETPEGNAQNVLSNLAGYREEATNLIEKTNKHYIQPQDALDRARNMEEDVARLEGRLKLLINSSTILRANSDEVNAMMAEIKRTTEMISALRQSASQAYAAQLSGTYQSPSDESVYLELLRISQQGGGQ